jgi:dihydrofolate reductase
MRKVIAAINMTLDGYCDHTLGKVDEEMHDHYTALLRNGSVILYGRITYHLMEYWRDIVAHPSGERSADEFAEVMDKIPKVVFSHTLQEVDWHSARLSKKEPAEELADLQKQEGGDILVGSRSLIISLLNEGLIDELQLCIHPLLAAGGLELFDQLHKKVELTFIGSKVFEGTGAVVMKYGRGVDG